MTAWIDSLRAGRSFPPQTPSNPEQKQIVRLAPSGGRAAVVVPLYLADDTDELRVILTRRSMSLRRHAGETAFPGGKLDDGETEADAAYRETLEEIGVDLPAMIDAGRAELLTVLDPVLSKHTLSVTPFVVFLNDVRALSELDIRMNGDEVSAVYSAPLQLFLRDDGYEHHDVEIEVGERTYDVRVHAWMYAPPDALEGAEVEAEAGEDEQYRIWGLTAWIATVAAMMAYQQHTSFELRRYGGLALGDFVPHDDRRDDRRGDGLPAED